MKNTGIVRRIDDLGRIVIPREIRHTLNIKEGDPIEIYTDKGGIFLQKYTPDSPWEILDAVDRAINSLGEYPTDKRVGLRSLLSQIREEAKRCCDMW